MEARFLILLIILYRSQITTLSIVSESCKIMNEINESSDTSEFCQCSKLKNDLFHEFGSNITFNCSMTVQHENNNCNETKVKVWNRKGTKEMECGEAECKVTIIGVTREDTGTYEPCDISAKKRREKNRRMTSKSREKGTHQKGTNKKGGKKQNRRKGKKKSRKKRNNVNVQKKHKTRKTKQMKRRMKKKKGKVRCKETEQKFLRVGEKPSKPQNICCVVDKEGLKCSFDPVKTDLDVPTTWKMITPLRQGNLEARCVPNLKSDQYVCKYNRKDVPDTTMRLKFVACNCLGAKITEVEINPLTIIKPSRVDSLEKVFVSSTTIEIRWKRPEELKIYPNPRFYVLYQSACSREVINKTFTTLEKYTLTKLPPGLNHTITIVSRPINYNNKTSGFLSEPGNINISTNESVPAVGPPLLPGSFSVNCSKSSLALYWKKIPICFRGGTIAYYMITLRDILTGEKIDSWKVNGSDLSSIQTLRKADGGYRVEIRAATEIGLSTNFTSVSIPAASEISFLPSPVNVILIENKREITWSFQEDNPPHGRVHIHWCYGSQRKDTSLLLCKNEIQQTDVPNSVYKYIIADPAPAIPVKCSNCDWHFGVSMEIKGTSSGIVWYCRSCIKPTGVQRAEIKMIIGVTCGIFVLLSLLLFVIYLKKNGKFKLLTVQYPSAIDEIDVKENLLEDPPAPPVRPTTWSGTSVQPAVKKTRHESQLEQELKEFLFDAKALWFGKKLRDHKDSGLWSHVQGSKSFSSLNSKSVKCAGNKWFWSLPNIQHDGHFENTHFESNSGLGFEPKIPRSSPSEENSNEMVLGAFQFDSGISDYRQTAVDRANTEECAPCDFSNKLVGARLNGLPATPSPQHMNLDSDTPPSTDKEGTPVSCNSQAASHCLSVPLGLDMNRNGENRMSAGNPGLLQPGQLSDRDNNKCGMTSTDSEEEDYIHAVVSPTDAEAILPENDSTNNSDKFCNLGSLVNSSLPSVNDRGFKVGRPSVVNQHPVWTNGSRPQEGTPGQFSTLSDNSSECKGETFELKMLDCKILPGFDVRGLVEDAPVDTKEWIAASYSVICTPNNDC